METKVSRQLRDIFSLINSLFIIVTNYTNVDTSSCLNMLLVYNIFDVIVGFQTYYKKSPEYILHHLSLILLLIHFHKYELIMKYVFIAETTGLFNYLRITYRNYFFNLIFGIYFITVRSYVTYLAYIDIIEPIIFSMYWDYLCYIKIFLWCTFNILHINWFTLIIKKALYINI
jgi:hypothetical protein